MTSITHTPPARPNESKAPSEAKQGVKGKTGWWESYSKPKATPKQAELNLLNATNSGEAREQAELKNF